MSPGIPDELRVELLQVYQQQEHAGDRGLPRLRGPTTGITHPPTNLHLKHTRARTHTLYLLCFIDLNATTHDYGVFPSGFCNVSTIRNGQQVVSLTYSKCSFQLSLKTGKLVDDLSLLILCNSPHDYHDDAFFLQICT